MYITNLTDYDNLTDDYNNTLSSNCTVNEISFDKTIPTLIFTKPCGPSFLGLISLMVYTLIEPLFNNK